MERRTFFGVFGTLLFEPEVVGRERRQVLYSGVKSLGDYHAQYGLINGVNVMLPDYDEDRTPLPVVKYHR